MNRLKEFLQKSPKAGIFIFIGAIALVFLLGVFAASIMERRAEALIAYTPNTGIKELDPRSEKWGKHFPKEYTSYLKTAETTFESKHNSSSAKDMLAINPRLVVLWAGYSFAKDYKSPRGHSYAITDIQETLRTGAPKNENDGPQPSTCWSCKSPDVPRVMKEVGIENFYKGKWASRGHEVVNAIGCADCHDEKTMDLKITRPALAEAFARQGKDITKATHQEKRSLVCAQCHVEYYFKGKDTYLTFPWDNGFKVEDIEKYYDSYGFSDWVHALSKAPMLKAQHPEYETWQLGIHAQRGVSCADCHMPYVSEGGVKFSDHHIQSPLNNINRSCQNCHRQSEETLKQNVYANQDKVKELKDKAEDQLVAAHVEAKAAWDNGAKDEQMKDILQLIRHAQWRWDFAVASHGGSAHAPLEMARILGTSIEKSMEARRALAKVLYSLGVKDEVKLPNISTKELAQKYIGFDQPAAQKDKNEFLKNVVPEWKKRAQQREATY